MRLDVHRLVSTHVETVVLLSREKVDGHIEIDLDVEKLEGKSGTATYAEIKKYVADHNDGMKVTSLYIGQIKYFIFMFIRAIIIYIGIA